MRGICIEINIMVQLAGDNESSLLNRGVNVCEVDVSGENCISFFCCSFQTWPNHPMSSSSEACEGPTITKDV